MKKLFSFVLALCTALATNAQPCAPNPQYADSSAGIWPAPGTMLPKACINIPTDYSYVFDIKTLTDTCVTSPMNLCLWIKAMRIGSVNGLPTGFTIVPNNEPWTNNGNPPNITAVQGCALLSAPYSVIQATTPGNYTIDVTVDLLVKNKDSQSPLLSNWTWSSSINTTFSFNYTLQVDICGSIDELPANRFGVADNFPNPFTGTTTIPFMSTKEETMDFKVYDVMGKLVHQNSFISQAGKNMYVFDATNLTSGVYVFTLSNGKETATRKMIIQN